VEVAEKSVEVAEIVMSASDQESRVRIIVSTDAETVSVADSLYGDSADKLESPSPWLLIGRSFLTGMPFSPTANGRGRSIFASSRSSRKAG
jgi:hypothetical protein